MKSIKAILAGCIFIIVVILIVQLAYIFIAVWYNELAKLYPVLNDISGIFRYLIGVPVFVAVMFVGGYVTATIANMEARTKVLMHCMVVGLLTAVGMIYPTLENSEITNTGIVIFILAIVATTVGGLYWHKNMGIDQA